MSTECLPPYPMGKPEKYFANNIYRIVRDHGQGRMARFETQNGGFLFNVLWAPGSFKITHCHNIDLKRMPGVRTAMEMAFAWIEQEQEAHEVSLKGTEDDVRLFCKGDYLK